MNDSTIIQVAPSAETTTQVTVKAAHKRLSIFSWGVQATVIKVRKKVASTGIYMGRIRKMAASK